jgi:polyhydroxyalkanoate synthesis regulator phasin
MNVDNLTQMLHRGFRVTLGATSSLLEILQDPHKRDENLEKIQSQWSQLSEEWAEKGAVTEEEARSFVDTILSNSGRPAPGDTPTSDATPASPPAPLVSRPDELGEIQELTAQIATLRAELKRLRESDSSD